MQLFIVTKCEFMLDASFTNNLIVSIQYQIRALDSALELLRLTIAQPVEDTDPRNPVCPECGSELSDITTMGSVRARYACTGKTCSWQGEL